MTEEKKATEEKNDKKAASKKADAPEESDQQKWDREHLELVTKLQEAKAAVVDHRYPSAEAVEAAKAAAATTVKAGAETVKKGAEKTADALTRDKDEEESKGAPKGPLPKSTEGFEKSSWPK